MVKIKETISKYKNGTLTKAEYIEAMYETHHSTLFDYSDFLKNTDIKKIEICDSGVVLTSRDLGIKILCPPGDHRIAPIEILNFSNYEKEDAAMIDRLTQGAKLCYDIGANMGWYSICTALANPDCKTHAFEPLPQTYSYLRRNIELNNVHIVNAHNIGLSYRSELILFYFYKEGSGNASSINVSDRDDVEIVQCEIKTLDEFAELEQHKIDFIKCDVEGAELMVFQGAENCLKRDKPIVFSEILRKWSKKFNYTPNDILDFFQGIGYFCFIVVGDSLFKIDEINENTLETNFFFLHLEQHRDILNELCRDKKYKQSK